MYRCFFYILFLFATISPVTSQVTTSTILWQDVNNKSVSIKLDNDTYYLTDYYYTYGLEIDLKLPVFNKTPLSIIFPKVSKNSNLITSIAIAQRLYTPKNTSHHYLKQILTFHLLDKGFGLSFRLSVKTILQGDPFHN